MGSVSVRGPGPEVGAQPPSTLRERLEWRLDDGEIRDGEVRYLMLRADALMGMFTRLPPAVCAEAFSALAASVQAHGGRSAAKYRAMGAADGARLLDVIVATAPQLGWGHWTLASRDADGFEVVVRNSPFAAGWRAARETASEQPSDRGPQPVDVGGQGACAAIVGMLRVVGAMVLDAPALAHECACAIHDARAGEPMGERVGDCRFSVRRASQGS